MTGRTATDDPAPSLRPHYRSLSATTSRSASTPRDGTQSRTVSAAREPPSRYRAHAAAVSGHAFSRSAQKQQTRLTSPLRRAPPGQSAGIRQAHPEVVWPPRFRCHLRTIDAYSVRLPDPHLTPPTGAFSSSLTTTVFSQRSTRRFEASPRRAAPEGHNLHLPRSTAFRNLSYTKLPPAFVTHPHHPLPPRRPHLRMRPSPALPTRPPRQASPRLAPRPAPARPHDLDPPQWPPVHHPPRPLPHLGAGRA